MLGNWELKHDEAEVKTRNHSAITAQFVYEMDNTYEVIMNAAEMQEMEVYKYAFADNLKINEQFLTIGHIHSVDICR